MAGDAQSVTDYVTENVKGGDIILLHFMYDSGGASREAVPLIVKRLKEAGYSFVTVKEPLA